MAENDEVPTPDPSREGRGEYSLGAVTQGSSFVATVGLSAAIPLGLSVRVRRVDGVKQRGCSHNAGLVVTKRAVKPFIPALNFLKMRFQALHLQIWLRLIFPICRSYGARKSIWAFFYKYGAPPALNRPHPAFQPGWRLVEDGGLI
jgi:hypothetical protein